MQEEAKFTFELIYIGFIHSLLLAEVFSQSIK